MTSDNGEYITVDFTAEELDLISQRAGYMAEVDELYPFMRQLFWQLALVSDHLSMIFERDEKQEPILEKYEE